MWPWYAPLAFLIYPTIVRVLKVALCLICQLWLPIPSISATRLFVTVALSMFQISALRGHAQYTGCFVLDDWVDALWKNFAHPIAASALTRILRIYCDRPMFTCSEQSFHGRWFLQPVHFWLISPDRVTIRYILALASTHKLCSSHLSEPLTVPIGILFECNVRFREPSLLFVTFIVLADAVTITSHLKRSSTCVCISPFTVGLFTPPFRWCITNGLNQVHRNPCWRIIEKHLF